MKWQTKFLNAGKDWPLRHYWSFNETNFSDTAVKGLQAEIKALQDEHKPLNREVVELKKALQATKNVLKYKEAEKEHSAFRKVTSYFRKRMLFVIISPQLLHDQARSLHLCHQETATQHQELRIKIEKDSRGNPSCTSIYLQNSVYQIISFIALDVTRAHVKNTASKTKGEKIV